MTKKDRCPKCGYTFETDMEKLIRMYNVVLDKKNKVDKKDTVEVKHEK